MLNTVATRRINYIRFPVGRPRRSNAACAKGQKQVYRALQSLINREKVTLPSYKPKVNIFLSPIQTMLERTVSPRGCPNAPLYCHYLSVLFG